MVLGGIQQRLFIRIAFQYELEMELAQKMTV